MSWQYQDMLYYLAPVQNYTTIRNKYFTALIGELREILEKCILHDLCSLIFIQSQTIQQSEQYVQSMDYQSQITYGDENTWNKQVGHLKIMISFESQSIITKGMNSSKHERWNGLIIRLQITWQKQA